LPPLSICVVAVMFLFFILCSLTSFTSALQCWVGCHGGSSMLNKCESTNVVSGEKKDVVALNVKKLCGDCGATQNACYINTKKSDPSVYRAGCCTAATNHKSPDKATCNADAGMDDWDEKTCEGTAACNSPSALMRYQLINQTVLLANDAEYVNYECLMACNCKVDLRDAGLCGFGCKYAGYFVVCGAFCLCLCLAPLLWVKHCSEKKK